MSETLDTSRRLTDEEMRTIFLSPMVTTTEAYEAIALRFEVTRARREEDSLRLALAEATHETETLKTERNAALLLAEQRGAAYDMAWREVESLREWKDKLEEKMDRITALVDDWRNGRAHLGTPATFVDQRLLDGILKTGVSVSGQRGGTVTFSHWSGAATKPDEEHGDGGPPEE